jgi:nucleotide-binding universal stress UspA family protein
MYEAIVVGGDGSKRASVAYRHALELAKVSTAKLHAVQVAHLAFRLGFTGFGVRQHEVDGMREQVAQTGARLPAEARREGE